MANSQEIAIGGCKETYFAIVKTFNNACLWKSCPYLTKFFLSSDSQTLTTL